MRVCIIVQQLIIKIIKVTLEVVFLFFLVGKVTVVLVINGMEDHTQLLGKKLVDVIHKEFFGKGQLRHLEVITFILLADSLD